MPRWQLFSSVAFPHQLHQSVDENTLWFLTTREHRRGVQVPNDLKWHSTHVDLPLTATSSMQKILDDL